MLAIERVSRRFHGGTVALDDISARIGRGDFVALLGPSGCGKSTLLRLLAGLDAPDAGRVVWESGAPKAGEIGFVFQEATLLPWATAAANVALPLRMRGVARREAQARAEVALGRVGLAGFEGAKPKMLSGGMRMRVSIARAMVTTPRLLLMDEPFAALDEFTRHKLQEDLHALWRESGTTIVFVTHSTYEAAFLASRILVMTPRPGRIAREIDPDLPQTAGRRVSEAYAGLVREIGETLHAVMPA